MSGLVGHPGIKQLIQIEQLTRQHLRISLTPQNYKKNQGHKAFGLASLMPTKTNELMKLTGPHQWKMFVRKQSLAVPGLEMHLDSSVARELASGSAAFAIHHRDNDTPGQDQTVPFLLLNHIAVLKCKSKSSIALTLRFLQLLWQLMCTAVRNSPILSRISRNKGISKELVTIGKNDSF